jgi:CheY-like chemotaxis protein
MVSGPIIIIEDDEDDKSIIDEVLRELNILNKIVWFKKCTDAVSYLKETVEQPFVIISDINLPGLSGVECKQQIDDDERLRVKSIPFVFLSTSNNKKTINTVYTIMNVQGYFQKPTSYEEIKRTIRTILEYWKICKHPNSNEDPVT